MKKSIKIVVIAIFILLLAACSPDTGLIGNPAPDFSLENTDGGTTTLSDYSGEPVLLFFHMAVG